jgi:hypothetical protein
MQNGIPICLIGGTGRSGTTILKRIFTRHPDVARIPEWRFSIDPDGLVDFYTTFSTGWSPFLYDVKLRRLHRLLMDMGRHSSVANMLRLGFKSLKIQRSVPVKLVPRYSQISIAKVCPSYSKLVDALMEDLTEFRYQGHWTGKSFLSRTSIAQGFPTDRDLLAQRLGDFFRDVIRSTLEHQKKSCYVEDNTWNILWFDKLLHLVPEAKLVHIYRDPRDVVASFMKQTWTPSDPIQGAVFFKNIMARWWEIRETLPADSYREISLEALVSDPKTVLQDVCRFWGIAWDDALLQTDLSRSHSGRWRKELNDVQKQEVNTLLSECIETMGYKI